jgi:NAD(P)H-dependent FMN reductase
VKIFTGLKTLPHFDPDLSANDPPQSIIDFRNEISGSNAILISTPEYVFSIPAGLKNALEWCVSTTIFSEKSTALLTASSDGKKAHEELQLIMKTLMANFTDKTTLLISGIKGKIDRSGNIIDHRSEELLRDMIQGFVELING